MTSSTWTYKTVENVAGCGIDLETVDRFKNIVENVNCPMPFVFTKQEIDHSSKLINAALGLCIGFTVKESVKKALKTPYNFTDCEVFPQNDFSASTDIYAMNVVLNKSLMQEYCLSSIYVHSCPNPLNRGEVMTSVVLLREKLP